jgi:tetratricopeptide (TPR) repeat protein
MIAPMGTTSTATMPMPAAPTALQQARLDLGLTQSHVIDHVTRLARQRGIALPSHESIRSRLSAWENGRATPDSVYASLLRTLYGRTDAELGFISRDNVTPPAHSHDEAMMEIRARLACSSGVDGDLIARLDRHTHELRLLDRRLGAATILDQISAHITTVRQLMTHTIHIKDRQALARIIADAAALAGWQALDTGATIRAWQYFDMARGCGYEAGDPAVLAHALGEQSFALSDLGHHRDAVALLDEASAVPRIPPLMRSWLAAAHAEMCAHTGDQHSALARFDKADALLPDDAHDPTVPYLSLDRTHLTRWRGHGLAILGHAEAIDYLTRALDQLDRSFVRAECALRADLAQVFHRIGERDQARMHALAAKQIAMQIGSERNRRRVLPLLAPI